MKAVGGMLGSLILASALLWPLSAESQGSATPADAAAPIAFAIVTECGPPGTSGPHQTRSGPVCVRDLLFIPPGDVLSAEVIDGARDFGLVVSFAPVSAQRILAYTTELVSHRVAILVDGRMVYLGPVTAPFGDDMQIGGLSRMQAEGLARRFKGEPAR